LCRPPAGPRPAASASRPRRQRAQRALSVRRTTAPRGRVAWQAVILQSARTIKDPADYELRASRSNAPSAARISAGSGWPGRRALSQGVRMNHCGVCEPHAGQVPSARVVRLLCLPVPLPPRVAPVCHVAACRASCPDGAAEALSKRRRARRDDRRLACAGQRTSARPGQVNMRVVGSLTVSRQRRAIVLVSAPGEVTGREPARGHRDRAGEDRLDTQRSPLPDGDLGRRRSSRHSVASVNRPASRSQTLTARPWC